MKAFKAPDFRMLKCAGLTAVTLGVLIVCSDAVLAGYRGHTGPVPEIDPGSLASAIALVLGGTAVVRGRIRR
jgi:hypothetical protein